ncbi:type VI secretion system Vgr family protein [Herbaspirillum rubrisubalbicans]|uniref:Type VI secretion system tip protein VgrG n=1 Tax=Herbaspirillum rubrisubalbicans TaxID=80842 RepID=A0AAD0XEU7_9BURK|nr:type VI secretion system Vgr family protein [Herbaspirillum rubrisubalbicans]AYR23466.1 type VI secretion system tip protein VgrG [Herbaspirillum rubrisubalbicans]
MAPPLQKASSRSQARIAQHDRLLKLDTPLEKDLLLPQRLVATDHLSHGYDYTIDLLATRSDLDLKPLIAQAVTLWIRQNTRDYLPIHGYVHTAERLGSDGELAFCQLGIAPWLHFLRFRKDARIWQDKTAEDILADIFDCHPQARGHYRFALERPALARSYCTQYETDWHFVQRLMEEEGWFAHHEQKEDGSAHVLVITDNSYSLRPLARHAIAFHGAGPQDELDKILHWRAHRHLASSRWRSRTDDYKSPRQEKGAEEHVLPEHGQLPGQLEIYEYTGAYSHANQEQGNRQADLRVEQWESAMQRYHAISGVREIACGRWFRLDGHPEHKAAAESERQYMIIAIDWFIENNLPLSHQALDFPGSLSAVLAQFKASIGRAQKSEAADNQHTGHCFNRFEVQRRSLPFRSERTHPKPLLHPQTAIVVGPGGEEVYTDHLNRIKVQFHWDRINPGNEAASCWVRVSYPNAGQYWGAINVPRIGQEVIVSFLNGDPDRPVVTGRLFNEEQRPQWHSNGRLSGLKSKEFGGDGFNQLVMDDSHQQNRLHLYSSHTHARLDLGHLVHQVGNERRDFYGAGFALKSDAYGAIITHKGLYISTYGRPGPQGAQLDTTEATAQLKAGAALSKTLSDIAAKAGAQALPRQDGLNDFIRATQEPYDDPAQALANRFKEPVLLAASPAGIGLTTPKGTHVHAGAEVTLSSGTDTHLAVGKSLLASVAEKISLFACQLGIKLFAAKGKVEVQAQSDDLDLIAEKVARLLSTSGRVEIHAKDEVMISAGGSFIQINSAGITQGTPGKWEAKASLHSMPGPARISYAMPLLPSSVWDIPRRYPFSQ